METVAVIDFETTGLSPDMGDRATEVAAVIIENGIIIDRFQSLMNAGIHVPAYIESLTGISNAMIRKAPPSREVMEQLSRYLGNIPLVAHNASFDSKFLDAEWSRVKCRRKQNFACSMLLARRIYPAAPNHKLGHLIDYLKLPSAKQHHRALADAEMAAQLWIKMLADIERSYGATRLTHEFMCQLQTIPKSQISAYIKRITI